LNSVVCADSCSVNVGPCVTATQLTQVLVGLFANRRISLMEMGLVMQTVRERGGDKNVTADVLYHECISRDLSRNLSRGKAKPRKG